MISPELFEALLNTLEVDTLARLAADLEEAQAEWQNDPQTAPSKPVREGLSQVLENLLKLGHTLAKNEGIEFRQLVEQLKDRPQQAEEWAQERARQERQNWYSDFG
jgi:hypothetical protein